MIRLHLRKAPADRVSGGHGREGKGEEKKGKKEKRKRGRKGEEGEKRAFPRKIPSALWVDIFFSAIRRIARRA